MESPGCGWWAGWRSGWGSISPTASSTAKYSAASWICHRRRQAIVSPISSEERAKGNGRAVPFFFAQPIHSRLPLPLLEGAQENPELGDRPGGVHRLRDIWFSHDRGLVAVRRPLYDGDHFLNGRVPGGASTHAPGTHL